ncbi:MAG: hypothetical protein AAF108_03780 [Planctomycetota bacterium]
MIDRRVIRGVACAAAASAALAGCGERGEAPESVRATRVVNASGDRIVTYQAYFDDGVVTYLDFEPFGEPEMITWARGDEERVLLASGFEPPATPRGGPEPGAIGEADLAAFAVVARGVDVSTTPWVSAGHGVNASPNLD